jgi:hypothetical protein
MPVLKSKMLSHATPAAALWQRHRALHSEVLQLQGVTMQKVSRAHSPFSFRLHFVQ